MQAPVVHVTVYEDKNCIERILMLSGNQSISWPHLCI